MKASELISQLKLLIEIEGDLEVYFDGDYGAYFISEIESENGKIYLS